MCKVITIQPKKEVATKEDEKFYPDVMEDIVKRHVRKKRKSRFKVVKEK